MEDHETTLNVIRHQLPAGFKVKEHEGSKAAIYSKTERVTPFFRIDTADQHEVRVASYLFAESFSLRAPFLGINLREGHERQELAGIEVFYNSQTMQRRRHDLHELYNIHKEHPIRPVPAPSRRR